MVLSSTRVCSDPLRPQADSDFSCTKVVPGGVWRVREHADVDVPGLERLSPGVTQLVDRAAEWAHADDRVRALIAIGSIGRGEADEYSDADLVAVVPAEIDRRELWADRRNIVTQLGGQPLGIRELTNLRPHLLEAIYPGRVICDLSLEDVEGAILFAATGHTVLVDKDGIAARLHQTAETPSQPVQSVPTWIWDWAWTTYKLLVRGKNFAAATSVTQLLHLAVFHAYLPADVAGRPNWQHSEPSDVLSQTVAARFEVALPTSLGTSEIHESLRSTMALVRDLPDGRGWPDDAGEKEMASEIWSRLQKLPR
jgi:hypothetical protein